MYWKVIDEAPAEQADTKLQAYRWDPFSQPIMYRPDANGCIEERIMAAEERSDPTTFRVESRAQFVEGINTYFEHDAVENVFKPFWNDRVLTEESAGRVAYDYKIHCDPALVNDMFSVMVAHAEDAPEDDSFGNGLLEYPHYTRPEEFRGWRVPEDSEYEYTEEYGLKLKSNKRNSAETEEETADK